MILSFQLIPFVILVFYNYKINSHNSTCSLHNHWFLNHRVLWLYDTWCYHTNILIPIQLLHIRMEVQLDQTQLHLCLLHTFCWLTQTNKSKIQFPQPFYYYTQYQIIFIKQIWIKSTFWLWLAIIKPIQDI